MQKNDFKHKSHLRFFNLLKEKTKFIKDLKQIKQLKKQANSLIYDYNQKLSQRFGLSSKWSGN